MPIRRLVIDVLIPHDPSEITYADKISGLEGIEGVAVHLQEIDEKTKTVEMTIEGGDLSFEDIKKVIQELGGSVHSIDQVSAGSKLVESKVTGEEE